MHINSHTKFQLGFSKFRFFNGQNGQEGETASLCLMSSKSLRNVQVTAYGRETVPDGGRVVRSCDSLQNFGDSDYITGTAEPKVEQAISILEQDDISPTKARGYGHGDCFKILPFVVMQRQLFLSYGRQSCLPF